MNHPKRNCGHKTDIT